MVEENGTPLWKIILVSAATAAISTIGLYYAEHPEKLTGLKKYLLGKVGYGADSIEKVRSGNFSEEQLNNIVEQKVNSALKKYFPNA